MTPDLESILHEANRKPGPIRPPASIRVLFAIEREINGMTPQERVRVRNERSLSLVSELERWLREQRAEANIPSNIWPTMVEAACWAHERRKFFDLAQINKVPIAIQAVERIDRPKGWTGLGGSFDRLPSLVVLEMLQNYFARRRRSKDGTRYRSKRP